MAKIVNFCENGSKNFNSVKFEAKKVMSPNRQEHLKGKDTSLVDPGKARVCSTNSLVIH